MDLRSAKARRFIRLSAARALREFYEPFFNRAQVLQLIVALAGTWIILQTADFRETYSQVSSWIAGAQALGIVLVGWAAISMIRAPFIVRREEAAKGTWRGNAFVYNEPQHIFTRQYFANDLTNTDEISFPDAEPGAYVQYSVEWEPPHLQWILAEVTPLDPTALPEPIQEPLKTLKQRGRGGCVVRRDQTASLLVRLGTGPTSVIVRVYCHSFELRDGVVL